jgi:hypothetical protein
MRAYEFLFEASGLKAAIPGEVYVDDQENEFKFQSWNWQHPADGVGYADATEMEQDILDIVSGDKNKITWVNSPTKKLKSFAYAVFAADNGEERLIGQFFVSKNPNNTIVDKDVTKFLGLSAGSATSKKSSTVKAEAALKPKELGLADDRPRNTSSVIKAVSSHTKGPMLVESLKQAASGQNVVFVGGAGIVPALQDDFGEVLAPVAMIAGHPQVVGQLSEAVADIFKGGDLAGAAINFPVGLTNPLIDSYITKGGISLGISSKGKRGAKATITNIWNAKEEAAQNPTGQAYIKKFKEAVIILDVCNKESGAEQPIILAKRYKVVSETELNALEEIMKNPRDPKYKLSGDPSLKPTATNRQPTPEDAQKVPPALKRLFSMGGYKAGSYVSYLCLARVAHIVANHINTDSKIDFGEAIRSFLNSSAMVQAKSVVGAKGEDAVLKSVNVSYPPNFKEKAKIESNGYSGTLVKGKFSFSLPST